MTKQRADILVVEQGLASTRARAQALILAGSVMCGRDRKVEKPGERIDESSTLFLRGETLPYVSRGGLKLAAGLEAFALEPEGRVCLDVGASTGGFTDCLLQRGARKVYAVDVGYGQLAWSLRQDPRVCVIERSNIRMLPAEAIGEPCSIIVIDVSFISLKMVLPLTLKFMSDEAVIVMLVKPQFEVGQAAVGKGGIVRDLEARERALQGIYECARSLSLVDLRHIDSPILGAKGNHEYLLHARYVRP